ncbi:MAG: T9SS type A sorting domain-containing protein, partial [Flavobacteriales bacterium]|nr:T9SS type A sorting domain-containing protein [Flavobacteriales bacterium]
GVDCGGSCAPCGGGGCTDVTVNSTSFNSWGIWNDGGSDCRRSSRDANYAYTGNYCVRLRDNTSTSTTTTDNLNLSAFEELTVSFIFYPRSMENNEDFWLQISTNGGSSYTTVATYAAGSSFNNNSFYTDDVVISGPFSSNTRIRFRCDASGNSDYIYLDDVEITGCVNGSTAPITEDLVEEEEILRTDLTSGLGELRLFPNPTQDILNIDFESELNGSFDFQVMDMNGRVILTERMTIQEGANKRRIETSNLDNGTYLLYMVSEGEVITKRFVVSR